MSSESPEPEHYSISEMMDRLKERSSDDPRDGELVTRADGSQAIKVRRKKRRTDQPERENQKQAKRLRVLQVIVILVLLLAVLMIAAGGLFYFNGSPYRNKLIQRISLASGGAAELAQFRVTPLGANAQSLSVKWPDQSVLKSISLTGVTTDLSVASFLGQAWSGDELTAAKGELQISEPTASGELAVEGDDQFRFTRFRCPDMALSFGNPQSPAMAIRGTEISYYPQNQSARPELRLTRGAVSFRSGLPPLNIDRGLFGFSGRQMEVISLRLEDPEDARGVIELSGSVSPFSISKFSTLDIEKLENFPIEHLVGQDFGRILSGRIEMRELPNSNFLSFRPGALDTHRVVLAFRGGFSSKLTLANLPFLGQLAMLLDDSGYERPVIESGATGTLRMSGAGCSIEDLRLESKSRITIRGSLTVASDKALSGRLEVGIPTKQVSNFLRRLDSAFSQPKEEMRWIDIEISGTTAAPADDFGKRLAQASPRPGADSSTPVASPRSLFDEATKPR